MKLSLGYVSLLPALAGALFSLASCTKPASGNSRSTTNSAQSNVNVSAKPTVSAPQIPNSDKYIDVVRQGTMTGYDSTTIGKAFEATFQNPQWESGETTKGVWFVEFKGMLPENLYKERYTREVQENQKCLTELEQLTKKPPYSDYTAVSGWATEAQHQERMRRKQELERDDFAALKGSSPDAQKFKNFYDTTISRKRSECGESPEAEETYARATFQWTFTVDGKSFELTYMDTTPWERAMGDFGMLSVAGYRDETTQDFIGGSEYIGKRRVPVTKRTISTDKVLAFIYH